MITKLCFFIYYFDIGTENQLLFIIIQHTKSIGLIVNNSLCINIFYITVNIIVTHNIKLHKIADNSDKIMLGMILCRYIFCILTL